MDQKQTNKKTLVTGVAGFVGYNMAKKLLEEGEAVCGVDNLITGQRENVEKLSEFRNFDFFQIDITGKRFVTKMLTVPLSNIYHFACPTGVPNIKRFGEEMIKTSSIGTLNVMKLVKEHGANVVYSSSAEAYGDPEVYPQVETYCGNVDPIGCRSAYEEGKRFSETIVKYYSDKYSLNAKIVRFFNAYGIGMSLEDTRVIPNMLMRIKQGEDLVIYGDGKQTRTFCYIDDTVQALKLVMKKGKPGEVYNIGGTEQITILDLSQVVLSSFKKVSSTLVFKKHFISDHQGRMPCVKKVTSLGWRQAVTLRDGIASMIEYYELQPVSDGSRSAVASEVKAIL